MFLVAQLDALATWLVNPGLLAAGLAATTVPLLIHLLNRQRFKVVDWAAMEFLLAADQQNRRRLQLENVLLLALRCLAVFLIGMVLARPFLPSGVVAGLNGSGRFERIVLLDDSLSMQARVGNETAWDVARRRVLELSLALAEDRADNSLTIILMSAPEQRVLDALPLRAETIDDVRSRIQKLECGNASLRVATAVEALHRQVAADKTPVNRIVYVCTDLRQVDWDSDTTPAAKVEPREGTIGQLQRLAKAVQGCTVLDAGEDEDANLSIVEVRSDGMLVAGVPAALEVFVKNQGSTTFTGVQVSMTLDGALAVETHLPQLQPEETASVKFPLLLGDPTTRPESSEPEPRRVKLEVASTTSGRPDRLAADDVAFFPARLSAGIKVLVIDGDPSERFGEAESFYLERALAPAGPIPSGVIATIASQSEAASLELDDYQVVFLLNADHLSQSPTQDVARLEAWVASGGGLIIMPGDHVDAQTFNGPYWKHGEGLSPLALDKVGGDPSRMTWSQIEIENVQHDVLKQFAGAGNPLLAGVKVFRWWHALPVSIESPGTATVGARLNDALRSPLFAEKSYGDGRVTLFAVPADAAWHNWPGEPSYLLVMHDLVRDLVSGRSHQGFLKVGEPIVESIDISRYEVDGALTGPGDLQVRLKATPGEDTPAGRSDALWQMKYPTTSKQGFYTLQLATRDGTTESRLLAANVPFEEGDLRRARHGELAEPLAAANIQVVKASDRQPLTAAGNKTEIAWFLLGALGLVLASEQFLGWLFGRWRT